MLVDAPRSLAEFKARLSVLSGHSLTIAPTRVPLAVFQAALAKEFGYCVVTSATFRDITLAGNSTAALVVRAKSNAVDAGLALLGQRTRVLSRLEMTFPRREYCLRVRASIGGSLAISGGLEADIGAIASVLQTTVGARDLGTA